ncbi:MAG: hypothetical protein NVV59_18705 [Chitinophagaceae bacterium]|nr:hypothetical protein [Chitinophagaceae bacterium]
MKTFYPVLLALAAPLFATSQIPMTPNPVACNGNVCTTNANIDVCPPGSNIVVTDHRNGVYHRGNNSNNLRAGAVWRFRNIAMVNGVTINGEVSIDEIYRATLHSIDDDNAVDQANVSIRSFFAPRISPDQNLNGTDRNGYVQFTMTFFRNASGVNQNTNADFGTPVSLTNINYVHYDIDGNDAGNVSRGTAGSWFRETGNARRLSPGNPIIVANSATDLSAYNYDHNGATWAGFAGTTCDRDGVSRCAQIASSFSFNGLLPGITFRMGYDYNAGGNIGMPVRQYGSRLGCFNFPAQSTLPVRLIDFHASYRNQQTLLSWAAEAEVAFEKYVVERSSDGSHYGEVGERAASGSTARVDYSYVDDLSAENGSQYFYRLKMVDVDGTYKYSSVLLVKRETRNIEALGDQSKPCATGTTHHPFQRTRQQQCRYSRGGSFRSNNHTTATKGISRQQQYHTSKYGTIAAWHLHTTDQ